MGASTPMDSRPATRGIIGAFTMAAMIVMLGVILVFVRDTVPQTQVFLKPVKEIRPLEWWGWVLIVGGSLVPWVLSGKYWILGLTGALVDAVVLAFFALSFFAQADTLAEWMLADFTTAAAFSLLALVFITTSERQHLNSGVFGERTFATPTKISRPLLVIGAILGLVLVLVALFMGLYVTTVTTTTG